MGEYCGALAVVIDRGNHIKKSLSGSIIQFRNKADIVFCLAEFMGEVFGGLPGPSGRAGYKTTDFRDSLVQPFCHFRSFRFPAVIEGTIEIILCPQEPGTFCMSDDEERFHY
jgi:hypothetical protein